MRRAEFQGFATDGDIAKARGIETVALYNWVWAAPGELQIYGGLNRLDDAHSDARNVTYIGGLAWLTFQENVIVAMEKTVDDSKTLAAQAVGNDTLSLFLRVNF